MLYEENVAVSPTLPPWVWGCYYFCIGIGLALTVMHLLTGDNHPRGKTFNLINLTFLFTVPIVFLIHSIGRSGTEYANFLIAFRKQELWTIFVVCGYIYVCIRTAFIIKDLWKNYKEKKKTGIKNSK